MGSDWHRVTLGKLVKSGGGFVQTGPFGSQLHSADYVELGLPSIMPVNIGVLRVELEGIARITEVDAARLSKHLVQEGDIVYSRRGDVTRKALIRSTEERMICGTGCFLVRPGNGVSSEFLNYHLSTPENREWIVRHAIGATMPSLNTSILSSIPLRIPSKEIQNGIVRVLSSLDDKIELNRQSNETLEAIAQALFKSWFVDFDPVIDNALAAGNEIPEPIKARAAARQALGEARKPLPEEIRREFSDGFEFVDEMGWVPRAWEIVNIESIAEKIAMGPFGSNIKVATFVDVGIPIISGHYLHSPLLTDIANRFITEEHALKLKNSMVRRGDIIFTHAGNIGQVSLIPDKSKYEDYVISQRQFYLRSDTEKVCSKFLLFYFRSASGQHKLLSNTWQVGVPSISRPSTHLINIQMALPKHSITKEFDRNVNGNYENIVARRDQSEILTNIRDTLLPKLLSGQLTIPDAEKLVADAQ